MNGLLPKRTKDLGSYPKYRRQHQLVCWIGKFSTLLLFSTLGFLAWAFFKNKLTDDCVQFCSRILLCFWALFPPLFFWAEYHILWRPYNDPDDSKYSEMFDRFKYSQETSSKIWLAMVTVLAAFCWEGLKDTKQDSCTAAKAAPALSPSKPALSKNTPSQ